MSNGLREQRAFLLTAICRAEDRLAQMNHDAIANGVCPCCVLASYGGVDGEYYAIESKLERQRAWLDVLDAKIAGITDPTPDRRR